MLVKCQMLFSLAVREPGGGRERDVPTTLFKHCRGDWDNKGDRHLAGMPRDACQPQQTRFPVTQEGQDLLPSFHATRLMTLYSLCLGHSDFKDSCIIGSQN
jgi:hypothetical protein